jgi:hypothetical protein
VRWRIHLQRLLVVGLVPLVMSACTAVGSQADPTVADPSSATSPSPQGHAEAGADLASLEVDDRPSPATPYRREEWPTWEDIDGDGCDAREQALIAQSITPAQVDQPGCRVVAGDWVSPYDGFETSSPSDLDADHLVPLENVHDSGGWRWDAASRRAYANDQNVLVMVSSHANRSKGSAGPDGWRPDDETYWCTYATRWVELKVQWELTITTPERDALGQMLDTCPSPLGPSAVN